MEREMKIRKKRRRRKKNVQGGGFCLFFFKRKAVLHTPISRLIRLVLTSIPLNYNDSFFYFYFFYSFFIFNFHEEECICKYIFNINYLCLNVIDFITIMYFFIIFIYKMFLLGRWDLENY